MDNLNFKNISLIAGIVALLVLILCSTSLVENQDASEIMVIQSPVAGDLTVSTQPGMKWQGMGKVTKYPRRSPYTFETNPDGTEGNSKKLRFNDGGHANMSGSVQWEMPLKEDDIIKIHQAFGSAEAVQENAVAKMIDAAIYMSGPLMSSTESSGERRAELVQTIDDQAVNGVYMTRVRTITTKDLITGAERQVSVTEPMVDEKTGMKKRQQGSILSEYNIKLMPLSIKEIKYDKIVEDQIAQRQNATTQVQIAQANAKRAEQDAITIAKQGEATAAKAKWEQETIKAQKVTEAEQKLRVAELAAKEAEQWKREQILRGEGEGARARLVMQANGALEQKLAAYIEVNKYYADAMAKYQGAWVPSVVMGDGNTKSNGASDLVNMLSAKTAKDLALDLSVKK